jgi:putative ABC transport system permease protein
MEIALSRVTLGAPTPLNDVIGNARYVSITSDYVAIDPAPEDTDPRTALVFAFDPRLELELQPGTGDSPAVFDAELAIGPEGPAWPTGAAIEVQLSKATADRMEWAIGEDRFINLAIGVKATVRLTGTFSAIDPASDYWSHNPSILDPRVDDDGNAPPLITGTAYPHPGSISALNPLMVAMSTTVWYPFVATGITAKQADILLPQLRNFTGRNHALGSNDDVFCQSSVLLRTGSTDVIESALSRAGATSSVLAMMAAGPFGVSLAVLALGARLLIVRRHAALSIGSARGGSGTQLRAALAIEGLFIGVPAAVVGIVLGTVFLPAEVGAEGLVLPIAIGLTPALLLALAVTGRSLNRTRSDLDPRDRGRFRWIIELLVAGIASLALFLLVRRGLTTSAATIGVDPLLAATPLLLALAVCVLVLRLYPFPLLWLAKLLRPGKGVTGYLGAVRAVRDPAAGLAPVLAMVVGVSVAVFSGVIFTTLDRGVDAAAHATVGADLQASGPIFSDELRAQIAALEGVEHVIGVDDAGPAVFRIDNVRRDIRVIVVDFEALRSLRSELPANVEAMDGNSIPLVISSDIADDLESDSELLLDGIAVTAVATSDRTTGLVADSSWVMVDDSFARDLTGADYNPRLLLLDLAATAAASIQDEVASIGGELTDTTTPEQEIAQTRASPAVVALQLALLLAVILAGIMCAVAVVMTSVVNASARDRLLAMLRTLGLSPRQSRSIAAWEIAPIAITAVVAGTALGIALPYLVLGSVDVRPFVGGGVQPDVALDPLLLLLVVGAFTLVVVASVFVAVWVARRVNPATALRMGEGG